MGVYFTLISPLLNLSSCDQPCLHIFRRISNICMMFHISLVSFTFHGYITNLQSDQFPDGLIAQLVEHCTGIAEVIASNPVQAGIVFRL